MVPWDEHRASVKRESRGRKWDKREENFLPFQKTATFRYKENSVLKDEIQNGLKKRRW